jgi:esterase/lipase superfamily enzyme
MRLTSPKASECSIKVPSQHTLTSHHSQLDRQQVLRFIEKFEASYKSKQRNLAEIVTKPTTKTLRLRVLPEVGLYGNTTDSFLKMC